MKTIKIRFVEFVSYFFILLFCYASISKIMDFENFQIQIGQSPMLSSFAGMTSYGILITELLVCILLVWERTRMIGIYGSFTLMILFSAYIYLILNYSEFVPCSCGGILEDMGWRNHLLFNIGCVILSVFAIVVESSHKKKSRYFMFGSLLVITFSSILLLTALHKKSEALMKKDNGFVRRFLQHPIEENGRLKLDVNSYYFAGINNNTLFLGNSTTPFTMTKVIDFKILKDIELIPEKYDFSFQSPSIEVHSGKTYITDGTVPVIYQAAKGTDQLSVESRPSFKFDKIRNITSDHFVIRAYNTEYQIQSLGILSTKNENTVVWKPNLLKKVKDGYFDPDGQLLYDTHLNKIIYVYQYRNQFITTDIHLNLTGQFRTIDTLSVPNLDIIRLKDGTKKIGGIPAVVNKRSAVYKGVLFIESDRIGKYELKQQWKRFVTIDLYSTQHQKYLGSFYLPKSQDQKRLQFTIAEGHLYVIKENEIIRYNFAQNIRQHFITGEAENLNQE